MDSIPVKVSGNVIDELSNKIPSNTFAINELLKNSYDAFARSVTVEVNRSKKTVSVSDDGNGMDKDEILSLLHIAKSSKKFGALIKGKNANEIELERKGKGKAESLERYCQGSKGLGFLAALKFGHRVTWETRKKGVSYSFSIDKQEFTSAENITDKKVDILTERSSCKSGTKITIHSSESEINLILEAYADESARSKIIGAIDDPLFEVQLHIDSCYSLKGKDIDKQNLIQINTKTSDLKSIEDIALQEQLFFVSGLEDNKVNLYNNGKWLDDFKFKLTRTDYTIVFELVIYKFEAYGTKKVPSYFKIKQNEKIIPLLFINDNLFNNYSIFDPDINRKKKVGKSLPQIIGKVKVYSQSEFLEFNSDRTNFVENNFTKTLVKDLERLNSTIQVEATKIRDERKKRGKELTTGKASPRDKKKKEKDTIPAVIHLDYGKTTIDIPSKPIHIKSLVKEVIDSEGKLVDKDELKVYINDELYDKEILESQVEPNKKDIRFEYSDPKTGLTVENIKLHFVPPKSTIKGVEDTRYFEFPIKSQYTISIPGATQLIFEVSKIQNLYQGKYNAMTACSLRAIIELSIDETEKHYPELFKQSPRPKKYGDRLTWKVAQILNFLKSDGKARGQVNKPLGMEFDTFSNLLNIEHFFDAVKSCHLAAHKSNTHLASEDLKNLASKAALLCLICDALCYKADKNIISAISTPEFRY